MIKRDSYVSIKTADVTPGCILEEEFGTLYFIVGINDTCIHVIVIGRYADRPSFEDFPMCPMFSHCCRFLYDPRVRSSDVNQGK